MIMMMFPLCGCFSFLSSYLNSLKKSYEYKYHRSCYARIASLANRRFEFVLMQNVEKDMNPFPLKEKGAKQKQNIFAKRVV